jgi:hypothetical protein
MNLSSLPSDGHASSFDWPGFLVIAALASLASLAISGFIFPTDNNLFHLPIVLNLYDEPQFAQDSFIQSLRHFASGFWMLLEGSASGMDPGWMFLLLAFASRLLSIAGFLACASLFGLNGRRERVIFAALICATFLLQGYSRAGGGGLFINHFTHSEIANGVFLLGLAFLLSGWVGTAVALTGLTFFINAFMGVWAACIFAPILAVQVLGASLSWRPVLARASLGAMPASLAAAPVVLTVISHPEFGEPPTFDYLGYLKDRSPYHFIFEANSLKDRAALGLITTCGFCASYVLGNAGRLLMIALAAACALYAVGIVVPLVSSSRLLINLHLMRAGTLMHLLSALAIAVLATSWLCQSDPVKTLMGSALAVAMASPIRVAGLAALIAILGYCLLDPSLGRLHRVLGSWRGVGAKARYGAYVFVAGAMTFLFWSHRTTNLEIAEFIAEWRQMATWARANTPTDSIFLVPVANWRTQLSLDESAGAYSAGFEAASQRRVWVDFKRGSAVMWSPSYYHEWRQRVDEASALKTFEDKLDYARRNDVDYVIEGCVEARRDGLLFATRRLCVYPVG